jgi:excisionase family DNA binding protein
MGCRQLADVVDRGRLLLLIEHAMAPRSQDQLIDLVAYSGAFVTVRQLSDYWNVSRKQVLKLIESGRLECIRLGPKTHRVPIHSAVAFERRNQRGRESLPE